MRPTTLASSRPPFVTNRRDDPRVAWAGSDLLLPDGNPAVTPGINPRPTTTSRSSRPTPPAPSACAGTDPRAGAGPRTPGSHAGTPPSVPVPTPAAVAGSGPAPCGRPRDTLQ